jgi:hypothetical protein
MDESRILWGLSVFLLGIVSFFFKTTLARIEKRLDTKLDAVICMERNAAVNKECDVLYKHKHAPATTDGRGGEVIFP